MYDPITPTMVEYRNLSMHMYDALQEREDLMRNEVINETTIEIAICFASIWRKKHGEGAKRVYDMNKYEIATLYSPFPVDIPDFENTSVNLYADRNVVNQVVMDYNTKMDRINEILAEYIIKHRMFDYTFDIDGTIHSAADFVNQNASDAENTHMLSEVFTYTYVPFLEGLMTI